MQKKTQETNGRRDATIPPLVLASQSPRRKELLALLGIPFTVVPAAIAEIPGAGERPDVFALRAAREKGEEVAARVTASVVLSADTVVAVDGEILGKPADRRDAMRMLRLLSGRRHAVYTGVCVFDQISGRSFAGVEGTDVWFRTLEDGDIADYLAREDVMDKAGAYAIQGFGAVYIPRIEGNYSNVMGLPLPLVHGFLRQVFTGLRL